MEQPFPNQYRDAQRSAVSYISGFANCFVVEGLANIQIYRDTKCLNLYGVYSVAITMVSD